MIRLPKLPKFSLKAEKLVPGLVLVVVAMAFVMGVMWEKINNLQGGTSVTTAAQPAAQQPAAQAQTTVTLAQVKEAFNQAAIKLGKADEKLVFLEVGDPSCPYCHVASGKGSEINKQMGDRFILKADGGSYVAPVIEMRKLVDSGRAAFAYIYTPGHGNGEMGMKAMYCASETGKFWQVHDLVMNNAGYNLLNNTVKNDKAQSQTLADFLKSAISPAEMKKCLDSGKYDAQLPKDVSLASSLGVTGTPGFFVNDKAFAGAYSWTDMQSAVDTALR